MRTLITFVGIGFLMNAIAQDVRFDRTCWSTAEPTSQRKTGVLFANEVRVDSSYTLDRASNTMVLVLEPHPLARYEYFPDGWTRSMIQIKQETRIDSTSFEKTDGTFGFIAQPCIQDIPFGIYEEYFHQGGTRVQGQVKGVDAEGRLIKTGKWIEWDERGKVYREQTLP